MVAVLLLTGLAFGSFVNALVWRLRKQQENETNKQDLSIIKGRSICTDCKHVLAWYDLIPLVSWLFLLRAKCRYCRKPISVQYPLVELLVSVFFILSYLLWPYRLTGLEWVSFITWLGLVVGFVALAVYDIRWMELPNRIIYILLVLAVFHMLFLSFTRGTMHIYQAVIGTIVLGGLFLTLFYISNGRWIGGGDVKLGFIIGTWIGGFLSCMLLLFLASLFGSLGAVLLVLLGKKQKQIPFGPFLILATIVVQFFGINAIETYLLPR